MIFGRVALGEAEGAVLAHSLMAGGRRLRKGRVLSAADIAALAAEGLSGVIAARLAPEDMSEDAAAARVAAALAPEAASLGLTVQAPFTGRVNLHAARAGLFEVDAAAVARFNAVDEAVTLATLAGHARVEARDMVATVKILPYAVPAATVAAALAAAGTGPLMRIAPPRLTRAALCSTRIPGMKDSVIAKGVEAVRSRLAGLGADLVHEEVVAHETGALAEALTRASAAGAELLLILGGSATQDREDVGPAALVATGGRLERFGMPVDPGNLLFLGATAQARPVIGLPGCVRSLALNGADWVLERVICGVPVGDAEIAAMGVGGLLKEIPSRPQPRGGTTARGRPVVEVLLLAAGSARRMRGRDKLLEPVADGPLLAHAARACAGAQVRQVQVVLDRLDGPRAAALEGVEGLGLVANPQAAEGMAASIRAGMRSLGGDVDAVIIALADMPDIGPGHLDRLIAAFDPMEGREICRAVTESGQPGQPVLFGRRFFESLAGLEGDRGARAILRDAGSFLVDVPTPGEAAVTDLDSPEAWERWRRARAEA
ncbi:4-diphosphocytidyl-2C-methyl-D-erythritol kinase (plasmid) [Paroceanicella profunda]|uniref:4-diphosphocytidyl-2C-methyl-D-erythritol kinase n=1 Tax=Paroceanicella profunda TaxID=2579971 RepID=A0A5B8FZ57_9RHOB|nr:molybdopterin-binding/glycosyltransferase family 2 protein [Paroceanicella profunda]QDL94196.1 4-diphosphocytidyl-2C-methyl-D-erythritol kinase [Paroceanicella profunda]